MIFIKWDEKHDIMCFGWLGNFNNNSSFSQVKFFQSSKHFESHIWQASHMEKVIEQQLSCSDPDQSNQFLGVVTREMIDLTSRTPERIQYELQIMKMLRTHLNTISSNIEMIPIGSCINDRQTNSNNYFNILIETGLAHHSKYFLFIVKI